MDAVIQICDFYQEADILPTSYICWQRPPTTEIGGLQRARRTNLAVCSPPYTFPIVFLASLLKFPPGWTVVDWRPLLLSNWGLWRWPMLLLLLLLSLLPFSTPDCLNGCQPIDSDPVDYTRLQWFRFPRNCVKHLKPHPIATLRWLQVLLIANLTTFLVTLRWLITLTSGNCKKARSVPENREKHWKIHNKTIGETSTRWFYQWTIGSLKRSKHHGAVNT